MQITIVQAEIETAIRNYIHSQINIREGMEISIDLQATRGAEGFRAIIDVSKTTEAKVVVAPVVATVPAFANAAAPAPKPVFPAFGGIRAPQSPAEVRQMMENVPDEEASSSSAVVEARTSVDESNAHPANATDEVPSAEVPSTPKAPSLFKGLRKPVNA